MAISKEEHGRAAIERGAHNGPVETRRGVYAAVGFFALGGILHFALAAAIPDHPREFWDLWDAAGRGLLSWGVAWGLWKRLSLFRSIATVYCVVMLLTYLVALGIAYSGKPAAHPLSLVIESVYEIPSCALLVPYFVSPEATQVFSRSLF